MAVQLPDLGAQARESGTADGRVRRGERNRDAIVDALLELFEEGEPSPTSRQIAERAGVSLRTVFQHFDDMEALCAAVSQRQIDRIWSNLDPLPGSDAPLDDRLDALVAQRAHLFEMIAPTRRAAVNALSASPTLMRGFARSEAFLRRQIIELFAAELAPDDADRIAALDFAASWEAWEGLRRSSRRSVESASRIMRLMLSQLLISE
jgi:TetR/AcrR family transcriptional regulator, regulator of autoinduction and epiphytic fitness